MADKTKLLAALEAARHALAVSHGTTATDRNDLLKLDPELTWGIDNSKEIALIDEQIKELARSDNRPS